MKKKNLKKIKLTDKLYDHVELEYMNQIYHRNHCSRLHQLFLKRELYKKI